MSNYTHPLLANLFSQKTMVLAIQESAASDAMEGLRFNLSNASLSTEQGRMDMHAAAMASVAGIPARDAEGRILPFNVLDDAAVIPIHGVLLNRFNSCWGFVTGYNYIKGAISAALMAEGISQIILDVNSPGGQVAGCFETVDFIREASAIKPITAIVDSYCCSAAYALSSGATRIITTPSGCIGSIGVVAVHFSLERLYENAGVKVTFIQAGAKKTLGTPYRNLSDSEQAELQKSVDESYKTFTQTVAINREIEEDVVIKTEAACYTSSQALELGLIDGVMAVEKAFDELLTKGNTMTVGKQQGANAAVENTAQPVAETPQAVPSATADNGAVAERSRIQAILGCDAAKTQPSLANHLAFGTSMSAVEAEAMLEAASHDAPQTEAKAAESEPKSAETNMLAEAMSQMGSPNVGADNAQNSSNSEKLSDADLSAIAQFANQ